MHSKNKIKKNNVIPVKIVIPELINKRNTLINHTVNNPQVKDEIDQINNEIATMETKQNINKISRSPEGVLTYP